MTALTDFLLARIDEDEAVARAALADLDYRPKLDTGAWAFVHSGLDGSTEPVLVGDLDERIPETGRWVDHATRHDPARVLAECEAKRRIVERLASVQEGDTDEHAWHEQGLFEAVGYLASVYADHDDYREDWRP